MSISQEVEIQNAQGLHARPAALFIRAASAFTSHITIENRSKGAKVVNAKSIMSVMSLSVKKNDHIVIVAEGDDEKAALDALVTLINNKFGEAE